MIFGLPKSSEEKEDGNSRTNRGKVNWLREEKGEGNAAGAEKDTAQCMAP
jgi:hypothetical protein